MRFVVTKPRIGARVRRGTVKVPAPARAVRRRGAVLVGAVVALILASGCDAIVGVQNLLPGNDGGPVTDSAGASADAGDLGATDATGGRTLDSGSVDGARESGALDAMPDAVPDSSVIDSTAVDSTVIDSAVCSLTLCGTTCVDTQDDPNNCGSCNTQCVGGTCALGRCLVQLSPGSDPTSIALGGGAIEWGASTSLLSVPIAGGPTSTLASGFHPYAPIATGPSMVYWAAVTTSNGMQTWNGIYSLPFEGGSTPDGAATPQEFLTMLDAYFGAIVTDATSVYWTEDSTDVVGATTFGGATTTIATLAHGTNPLSLAVDNVNVYWTNNGGLGPYTIQSAQKTGGAPTTIFTGNYGAGIATDGTYVYWTDPTDGAVMKMIATGAVPTMLASAQNSPAGIVVADGFVYWTNGSTTGAGSIMKVSTTGGAPIALALGQNPSGNLVVDATSVYWFNWPAPSGVFKVTPR